jgi:hypothetical protein
MITSLILASLASSPLTWQQIEIKQDLILNAPITLSKRLTLPVGTKTSVTDLLPLGEINVILMKMDLSPCETTIKNEESDLVIVNELYGVKLEKDCKFEVYLESADLSKPSLFGAISR